MTLSKSDFDEIKGIVFFSTVIMLAFIFFAVICIVYEMRLLLG